MAYPITLGDLVEYSRQLANKPAGGDQQIEPAEWKTHVSTWYGRLHKTVSEVGVRVFETEVTINLAALALPADHWSTIGVDHVLDTAGRRRELGELMMQERNDFTGVTSSDALAWALSGTNLVLYPQPSSGTYKHIYVPQPTRYSTAADSTSVDVLTTDGLEMIGWGVASVGLHRGESAQQRAVDESNAAQQRLKEWGIARALTMPKRQVFSRACLNLGSIYGAWNPASWRWR